MLFPDIKCCLASCLREHVNISAMYHKIQTMSNCRRCVQNTKQQETAKFSPIARIDRKTCRNSRTGLLYKSSTAASSVAVVNWAKRCRQTLLQVVSGSIKNYSVENHNTRSSAWSVPALGKSIIDTTVNSRTPECCRAAWSASQHLYMTSPVHDELGGWHSWLRTTTQLPAK